jgi:hypothetical protein
MLFTYLSNLVSLEHKQKTKREENKMIQANKVPNTDQDYIDLKKQCESQDSIFKDISLDNFKKIVKNYLKINSDITGLTN